jgi:hypothetical protein
MIVARQQPPRPDEIIQSQREVSGLYIFERRLNAFGLNREQPDLFARPHSLSDFLLNRLLNGFKSTLYDPRSLAAWRSAESRESNPFSVSHLYLP